MKKYVVFVLTIGLVFGLVSFKLSAQAENDAIQIPLGLPPLKYPPNSKPASAGEIALGKQLYFDTRLSSDKTVSCASCHDPAKGWSNGTPFATGIRGQVGGRSSPSIINAAYHQMQFWDGRADWVEGQALGPIENPIEMDMKLPALVERLKNIPGYRSQFEKLYKDGVTAKNIGRALASFERTVLSGDAPYDRYKAGDKKAMSPAAERGMKLFFGKAHCVACHSGPLFSDGAFHNIGVGMKRTNFDKDDYDKGREAISTLEGDRGAFKTPGLRDIARTAPYMHDGSEKTLEDVIEYYNRGGNKNPWLDEEMFELKLTAKEKADLATFLREGLASSSYPMISAPSLPADKK